MTVVRLSRSKRDSDLVAAVDVGASKAACLIALLAPGPDGVKTPEIIGAALQGRTPQDARTSGEAALRAAVEAAERMAAERVRAAYCAAPGRALHTRRLAVELDVAGGRVTPEDVVECLAQAANSAAPEGYRALHAAPIAFRIDGENVGREPQGLAGSSLSAEVLGVSGREARIADIETTVERAGLRSEDCFAAPVAAAEATLTEDEKDLGVLLLDLGESATAYARFEKGALVDCGGVGLGGGHITRDIAQIFGAPIAQAERAKTLYGAAHLAARDEHALVGLRQLGDEEEVRVSRAELSAVITPRLEEIFELVAERLPQGRSRHATRRLVLTGGGSLLVGARETAERMIAMRARLGRPAAVAGAPDAATGPQFSVCAGLILLAARRVAERRRRTFPAASARVAAGGVFSRMGSWLRDNF